MVSCVLKNYFIRGGIYSYEKVYTFTTYILIKKIWNCEFLEYVHSDFQHQKLAYDVCPLYNIHKILSQFYQCLITILVHLEKTNTYYSFALT